MRVSVQGINGNVYVLNFQRLRALRKKPNRPDEVLAVFDQGQRRTLRIEHSGFISLIAAWMQWYEITHRQFDTFEGNAPSIYVGDNLALLTKDIAMMKYDGEQMAIYFNDDITSLTHLAYASEEVNALGNYLLRESFPNEFLKLQSSPRHSTSSSCWVNFSQVFMTSYLEVEQELLVASDNAALNGHGFTVTPDQLKQMIHDSYKTEAPQGSAAHLRRKKTHASVTAQPPDPVGAS